MASISFTDSTGSATLTNGMPIPADRFGGWTPRDESIGPSAIQLPTGRIYGAKYRRDGLVEFELRTIPGSELPTMLRLKLHLMKGGIVTVVATQHELGERWALATLAPGTEPSVTFADSDYREYTFGVTLREAVDVGRRVQPGVGILTASGFVPTVA
jgi:hypothetical protein